jgi:hypothetical protein
MTAAYNDAINKAAAIKSDIVFLNADMIYSAGTFRRLVDLIDQGKRCVEIEGFRVNKLPVERALRQSSWAPDSATLVKLALNNIHLISLCHFWEPETDFGFLPFHTYWRADRGLLARASHLYPLYLYPRDWDALQAAKTIDWDLSDKAGLRPDEMHVVRDSEEIFSVELSDQSYAIDPSFPNGASIQKMREFVDKHCTPEHRARLSFPILFRADPTNNEGWRLARIKSTLWYKAVCEKSNVHAAALMALSLPSLLRPMSIKLTFRGLKAWTQSELADVLWFLRVVADKYRSRGIYGVLHGFVRQTVIRIWALRMIAEKHRRDGLGGVFKGIIPWIVRRVWALQMVAEKYESEGVLGVIRSTCRRALLIMGYEPAKAEPLSSNTAPEDGKNLAPVALRSRRLEQGYAAEPVIQRRSD